MSLPETLDQFYVSIIFLLVSCILKISQLASSHRDANRSLEEKTGYFSSFSLLWETFLQVTTFPTRSQCSLTGPIYRGSYNSPCSVCPSNFRVIGASCCVVHLRLIHSLVLPSHFNIFVATSPY